MADMKKTSQEFLTAVGRLIAPLDWELRSFTRDGEVIALAALNHDPTFEQMLWVYCPDRDYVRCLLVARGTIASELEPAVIELCARINDGLIFGCAEYSFSDQAFAFRDSLETDRNTWNEELKTRTARLLELGSHFAPAWRDVMSGRSAGEALQRLELGLGDG